MNKIGKFLAVLFIFAVIIVSAMPVLASEQANSEYYISAYDINMQVNEDNSIDVTETITANFNVQKHGIYRYIPIKNYVERADGTTDIVNARIKNVKSNEPLYDTYTDGNNYVIQIGDPNEYLIDEQEYVLSYTYVLGKDKSQDYDELYYNLIGTGWDTSIDNVTFCITMPKEFDSEKLGFSTGEYGIAGTNIVKYTVDANVISGYLTDKLDSGDAFTMRLELPEGYFKFNAFAYYFKYFIMLLVPVLALVTVILLWIKYGRDKKIVDVVEFYPPEGMNCAEVAYWYNGSLSAKDTVPMLIELANEGYIKIEDCSTTHLGGRYKNDSFVIIRRKSYDGNDKNKEAFFNGLFESGSEVCVADLEERFYTVANSIVHDISSEQNEKVFVKKSLIMRFVGWTISVLSAVFDFLILSFTSNFSSDFLDSIFNLEFGDTTDFVVAVCGMAISAIAFLFSFFIRQRTDDGHEVKQRINGFRIFLEKAEKERLEMLVEENPTYFYDMLPYAYVLGVSDKWVKNFEGIAIEPPTWYFGYGSTFDRIVFYHFINRTMSSAERAMISTPQNNSSGGGFSGGFGGGGGFSGGGVGGGGGGSW